MVPSPDGLAPFQVVFVVRDLDHLRGEFEMEAAGHPAIARIHSFGADGDRGCRVTTRPTALGFLVEAVEPPARMPGPDFTM